MNDIHGRFRDGLMTQYRLYPRLTVQDVFKYLFQSAFGCEHLVAAEDDAHRYICEEYARGVPERMPVTEMLYGAYGRVHLHALTQGLSPKTLAALFCRSACHEAEGEARLHEGLAVARSLVGEGLLPFSVEDFDRGHVAWREAGYGAVRHSEAFREQYRPAYRVVKKDYIRLLPLLMRLDARPQGARTLLALEGGSAAGKTTLARLLGEIYGCTVLHIDDFFLRPEQRTEARMRECGGNVDRERFLAEVLLPLSRGECVDYRRFDCQTQTLLPPERIRPSSLCIVEGAYAMHPALAPYYTLSAFLDVDPITQRERVYARNTPSFAERYVKEWIPKETEYFSVMRVKERCDLVLPISLEEKS